MLYRPTLKLSNHKWLLVAVLITTLLMPALVSAGAGGTNIVRVNNQVDHAFRFKGSIELGQDNHARAAQRRMKIWYCTPNGWPEGREYLVFRTCGQD
jgi:hypothetical protein